MTILVRGFFTEHGNSFNNIGVDARTGVDKSDKRHFVGSSGSVGFDSGFFNEGCFEFCEGIFFFGINVVGGDDFFFRIGVVFTFGNFNRHVGRYVVGNVEIF